MRSNPTAPLGRKQKKNAQVSFKRSTFTFFSECTSLEILSQRNPSCLPDTFAGDLPQLLITNILNSYQGSWIAYGFIGPYCKSTATCNRQLHCILRSDCDLFEQALGPFKGIIINRSTTGLLPINKKYFPIKMKPKRD